MENEGRWDDALALVSNALSLDPADLDLKTLKQQIESHRNEHALASADAAVIEATADLKAGELDRSLSTIEEGLRTVTKHKGLLKLRREVLQAIDREKKIQGLLTRAKNEANAGNRQLSLQLVTEGLRLAPEDKRLVALKERLDAEERQRAQQQADHLILLAKDSANRGQLQEALALTSEALQLQPKSADALGLQAELRNQLDERERRARVIEDLNTAANEALAADKPQEALEAADKLLALEPNHQDGLALKSAAHKRLAEQQAHARAAELLARAKAELDGGHQEAALDLVSEGLKAVPGDTVLMTLKTQIEGDLRTQHQVSELVATAGEKLTAGDYDAASSLIQKAQAVAPDDARVTALRREIEAKLQREALEQRVLKLQQLARKALDNDRPDESLSLVEQALKLLPDDPASVELRKEVEAKTADAENRRRQINKLIAEAQRKQLGGDPTSGLPLAEQALRLAPDDPELTRLVATLRAQAEKAKLGREAAKQQQEAALARASALLEEARRAQDSGRIHEAVALVQQGLERVPQHEGLLTLDKQLHDAVARETRITDLLAQCETHLREGRLTTGSGGTAFDCYKSVIELEATNQAARDGLRRISEKYASWASAALNGNNVPSAQVYLERLQTVDPEYPELTSLRKQAEMLQREQRDRARVQTRPSPNRKRQGSVVSSQAVAPPKPGGTQGPALSPRPPLEKEPPNSSEPAKRRRIWGTF